MRDIVIHNWDELQKLIFQDVWQDDIKRYRADIIYRGVGDANFTLMPKLNRVCPHNLELESSIIRSFRKYAYADLRGGENHWQILTLAQHHGLPTRLLDWSYSPLVAAHFATEEIERYDCDGCIYCLDYSKMSKQLPKLLATMLQQQNTSMFSIEMLDKVAKNFDELKNLSDEPFALFFEPSSMHDRIINQYALFSITSDPAVSVFELADKCDIDYYRIIIPKEVKLEIRDKLDYINISERMIYPGLDGICKWITRRYSDLGPSYNKNK